MRLIHVCYVLTALAIMALFLDLALMLANVGAFVNTVPGQEFTPAASTEVIKGLLWASGGLTVLAFIVAAISWNRPTPRSAFGKPIIERRR